MARVLIVPLVVGMLVGRAVVHAVVALASLLRGVVAAIVMRDAVLVFLLNLGDHAAEFAVRAERNVVLPVGFGMGGMGHGRHGVLPFAVAYRRNALLKTVSTSAMAPSPLCSPPSIRRTLRC